MQFDNELNKAEEERLVLLAEECSEVIQAISKVLRHGYESKGPRETGISNREKLAKEIGDVLLVIDMMKKTHDVDTNLISEAYVAKKELIKPYLHYQ